jgi:predicted RNase H-like HicB family nuclease
MRRYPVVIEQTGTGYSAWSPDVSGCVAVGDTEEETRRNFQDA